MILPVALLAVKALLAPTFVVGASLTVRRFGPEVGGLVGGLPVVAGPILLVYALAQGQGFASRAAAATLLGLVSLTAFVVVYGRLAEHAPWTVCLLAATSAFGLGTLLFTVTVVPAGTALALAGAGFVLGLVLLPRPQGAPTPPGTPPAWDLPLRAGCALALVLVLTSAASSLGSQLSGLLAPFPIITTVLATFTHAQRGSHEAVRLLRGMLTGFIGFALFCFTLAVSLRPLGVAAAFGLATAVALLTQATMIRRSRASATRSVEPAAMVGAAASEP
jgi:hypothetical protein